MLEPAGMFAADFHKGILCCCLNRDEQVIKSAKYPQEDSRCSVDDLPITTKTTSCGVGIHFRTNKSGALSVHFIVPEGDYFTTNQCFLSS